MRIETAHDYGQAIARAVATAFALAEQGLGGPTEMAQAAGFSPFHFSRMFAGMVGESPGEFVRRLRLERAAWRLRERARVTEVAFEAGYERPEAFCRAFRSAFACPPSAFCASCLAPALPNPSMLHFRPGSPTPVFVPRLSGGKAMNIEIRDSVPSVRVVALRHVGAYHRIGPVFGRLQSWLQETGVAQTGPGIAIYHDDPETTPEAALRSDACAPVAADAVIDDPEVRVMDLPGGRYAVATHVGPYSGLGAAWGDFLGKWLPASGERIDESRVCFEVYVDDCAKTDPATVRTELYQAVR